MKRKIVESICFFIIIVSTIYGGIKYKGNNKVDVNKEINAIKVEEYVEEYLSTVTKDEWKNEFIKVMSVIIRTSYVYDKIVKQEDDISYVTNSMEVGIKREKEELQKINKRISDARKETKDEVITYHGNIIYPFFHEVSSRITKTEDDVLGVKFEYLKKKQCDGDIMSKDFFQIKYFNKKDIEKKFNKNENINTYEMVKTLGLNSPNISITTYTENENILRVVSKGKGHGLGLSIYDANQLAKKGLSYKEIINSYYKDVLIKKCIYE